MEVKTGAWRKTAASGVTYYFGMKDGVKVTIFKNKKREGKEDSDPDLSVIVDIDGEAGEGQEKPPPLDQDDDIPF